MPRIKTVPFAAAMALTACVSEPAPDLAQDDQAIASNEGKFDVAIDAPWRIEPRTQLVANPEPQPGQECFGASCVVRYPAIPIQLTVHDADAFTDALPPTTGTPATYAELQLGDFLDVTVTERAEGHTDVRTFQIGQLREIETLAAAWPNPNRAGAASYQPDHRVCKAWENPWCAPSFRDVGNTNEWHATLMYRPRAQTLGTDVELDVTMRISRRDSAGEGDYRITEHLRVHLAAASLPRFGPGWAYGDLHYHSQGTDNDGESAYAYRGVLQAMAAMGLDFVVAADHASNSAQATNVDPVDIASWTFIESNFNALRDMSPARYRHLHDWLHLAGGGNHQVAQTYRWQDWGLPAIPQIILGGEVDAIPELGTADLADGLRYGNGRRYRWFDACRQLPPAILGLPWDYPCDRFYDPVPGSGQLTLNMAKVRAGLVEQREPGRYLLKDPQGRGLDFARQHLIYVPSTLDHDGFVSSSTGTWGGGSRRLADILRQDFEQRGLGHAFLAHPVAAASGSGFGRVGPDIVPYSDAQLETAFASRHVLGLQLWNEDARVATPVPGAGVGAINWITARASGAVELDWWPSWRWGFAERRSPARGLQQGTAAWDKLLLWGLDPARTGGLPWLTSGQPRRVFMAGGSDAHGDLNVRRDGAVRGTDEVTDTAIGKPRNLVFVGTPAGVDATPDGSQPRSWSQAQLVGGLASGQFAVTDGPAARIAIDVNRNGVIDDGDVAMGGVRTVAKGERVPIVVEFMSTPEFGKVTGIDLYVGVHADALRQGMIYAPFDHGLHGDEVTDTNGDGDVDLQATWAQTHVHAPTGRRFERLNDHYWGDVTLRLGVADHPFGQVVRRTFELDPARFPVLSFDCNEAVDRLEMPDRLFVRAFVRSAGKAPVPGEACDPLREECLERWAFTNPVWAVTPPPLPTGVVPPVVGTVPPPAPFEAVTTVEAVRVERRQGRQFDRGLNSQCFDGTYYTGSPGTWPGDPWRSFYAIAARRAANGWNGVATSAVFPSNTWLVDGGHGQHFNLGWGVASLYFNPHVWPGAGSSFGCAYVVFNGIRAKWFELAAENGALGYPVTDERYYGGGAYQYFDKGAVFWKAALGTVVLPGELAVRHLELMRAGGAAFPTWSGTIASQPAGQTALLENGARLFAKGGGAAFVVDGAILARYQALGGALSFLGYPIADAQTTAAGTRSQRFEGGTLFSGADMDLGVCIQAGALREPRPLPDRPGQ